MHFKEKIMERPGSERFEVRVSRWKLGVQTIILSMITAVEVIVYVLIHQSRFYLGFSHTKPMWAFMWLLSVIILVIVSVTSAATWLRCRPFFAIDDQGITDYGVYLQGFGLIRWQNIERVGPRIGMTLFGMKGGVRGGVWGGVSLFVKVNNYKELVSRRNPLMRLFLLLRGRYLESFGGQILLPIELSNTDSVTVREQISHYSKNRF
jgi:hypothetical protein